MAHLDIDPPLIISDYIHVTRSFYEGAESKLVNGILDSLKTTLDR
ncbi:MAG: transcription antitermination factor NusB, partial [Rhodospirillales bacterium]|nr:transcription antitermination factor NusB [Rhodospirillales bacterium]